MSLTRDVTEFATSTTREQLEGLLDQAELIMVAILAAIAGTTLLHALLVFLWCKLPSTRHKPLWKALLFPVPEVVITGLLALPIGLVATTLLVSPEASVSGKAMAGLGLGLLALFLALVYMVLAAVARRRQQLGLQYVDALEGSARRWVDGLCAIAVCCVLCCVLCAVLRAVCCALAWWQGVGQRAVRCTAAGT